MKRNQGGNRNNYPSPHKNPSKTPERPSSSSSKQFKPHSNSSNERNKHKRKSSSTFFDQQQRKSPVPSPNNIQDLIERGLQEQREKARLATLGNLLPTESSSSLVCSSPQKPSKQTIVESSLENNETKSNKNIVFHLQQRLFQGNSSRFNDIHWKRRLTNHTNLLFSFDSSQTMNNNNMFPEDSYSLTSDKDFGLAYCTYNYIHVLPSQGNKRVLKVNSPANEYIPRLVRWGHTHPHLSVTSEAPFTFKSLLQIYSLTNSHSLISVYQKRLERSVHLQAWDCHENILYLGEEKAISSFDLASQQSISCFKLPSSKQSITELATNPSDHILYLGLRNGSILSVDSRVSQSSAQTINSMSFCVDKIRPMTKDPNLLLVQDITSQLKLFDLRKPTQVLCELQAGNERMVNHSGFYVTSDEEMVFTLHRNATITPQQKTHNLAVYQLRSSSSNDQQSPYHKISIPSHFNLNSLTFAHQTFNSQQGYLTATSKATLEPTDDQSSYNLFVIPGI